VKSASSTAAIAAAKFILLNHVPLSQMAMVVAGLASSGAASPPSIEASSVVIGCIPLVNSGALLLRNMLKLVAFLRRKWYRRREQTTATRSGRNSYGCSLIAVTEQNSRNMPRDYSLSGPSHSR
jgi:hypothetical protein